MAARVSKKKTTSTDAEPSFEQALAELEALVAELESGELGLDASLARYEAAVARLRLCHQKLEQARLRVELITGVDAEGKPTARPLESVGDESLEAKGAARSRRRSADPKPDGVDSGSTLF